MAIVAPVLPPFYLAGALSAEGLVLPVSGNDAAVLCAVIGAENHTYMRITSATSLEVVKATCGGTVISIERAINESFAVAHPLGACVTIDMDTICAMRDVFCQELGSCPDLATLLSAVLLADTDYLQALAINDTFEAALCANTAFKACLITALTADSAFITTMTGSVGTALLAYQPFLDGVAATVAANSTFLTTVTGAITSSPSLIAAVANAVLASPNFCQAVAACGGVSGVNCLAPQVTVPLSPSTAEQGAPYVGTFTLSPATAVTLNNLPAGVTGTLNVNTGVVTLTGTPTGVGISTVSVTATNACGSQSPTTVTLALGTLTVGAAGGGAGACPQPAILSPLSPSTTQAGVAYTGTISVTNTTGAVLTGLPSWATASFNQGTQLITITGTPTGPMSGATVALTNACGGALSTSYASGLPIGNLTVTPPTLAGTPSLDTQCAPGGGLVTGVILSGVPVIAGATGWQLVQASPAAVWNLPVSPNGQNVLLLGGFSLTAAHTIQAVGPWGTTNAINVTKIYNPGDPCPGGA
jgi:hypothetical protein